MTTSNHGGNTQGARRATGSSGQNPDQGLARQLSELARDLQAEPDANALLEHITDAAVLEIDGAEHADISLIEHRTVVTRAATGELSARVDRLQTDVDEGPCLSSLRNQETVRSDDLRSEPRWPRFAAAAAELGVRSMLSAQLFVDGDNLGALNLYSSRPAAFDDHAESVAMLLASHAAIAMKGTNDRANLRVALASRDLIGQAKGILTERYKIDDQAAFELLVVASQHGNRKLTAVAEELTGTGVLRGK